MIIPSGQVHVFGFVVAATAGLMLVAFLIRYLLRRRQGLRFVREGGPADLSGRWGPKGLGGYRVKVDPERSTLSLTRGDVELGIRRLHLACAAPRKSSGEGSFATGVGALDRFFGARRADSETAARIAANRDRLGPVTRFLRRWGEILEIRVDERSVTFRWRRWLGATHGVPAARTIECQLPEMIQVANALLGAAAVPPLIPYEEAVREGGERLLFARSDALPGQLVLERPGAAPEQMTPSELVDRLYYGGLSPLSRVSWEGQATIPVVQQPVWERLFVGVVPAPSAPARGPSRMATLASRVLRTVAYSPQGLLCIGGVVALSGLFSAWTFYDWDEHARADRWPARTARVLSSKTRYYSSRSSSSSDARGRGPGTTTSGAGRYGWRVTYTYAVDGRTYTGSRHCLVSGSVLARGVDTKAQVDKLVRRYPSGSAVQILYDPQDPSEAVFKDLCHYKAGLKTTLFQTMQIVVGVCVALSLLALCFVLWRLAPRLRGRG